MAAHAPELAEHGARLDGRAPSAYLEFRRPDGGSVARMAVVRARGPRAFGRYLLGERIASGGMATVHFGRLVGAGGFARTVAIKKLHAHLGESDEFVSRFVDEARIAARVRHANVVATLDVLAEGRDVALVLEYVHGESFARLRRLAIARGAPVPPAVASAVMLDVLRGLHAAHEATSERGEPLCIVHRDVSPQNVLVGVDGVTRVLDFGIAKAEGRVAETKTRDIKGKLAYMPPEQICAEEVDRRSDLFPVGVMLWEALAGERLFRADDVLATMEAVLSREPPPLAGRAAWATPELDAVLARALAKAPSARFATADEMARALEAALPPAPTSRVAAWVAEIAGDALAARAARLAAFERNEAALDAALEEPADEMEASIETPVTPRHDALVPPPLSDAGAGAGAADADGGGAGGAGGASTPIRTLAATIPAEDELEGAARASAAPAPAAAMVAGAHNADPNLATPLVMVAPVEVDDWLVATRVTKETPPRGPRTPIPMPAPPPTRRAPSLLKLGMLVVVPPVLAAAALLTLRPATSAGTAGGVGRGVAAAATLAPPTTTPDPGPAPAPGPPAAPAPTPSVAAGPSGTAEPGGEPAASASAPVKGARHPPHRGHLPWRPARPNR